MFKKIFTKLLAVVIFMGMVANPALAAKTTPPSEESTSNIIGIRSLLYIQSMETIISDNGDGTVDLFGTTTAKTIIDEVGVKLFLQKWDGSSWVDIKTSDTFKEYNHYLAEGVYACSVEPGYYYQAKGVHTASNDGVPEQEESFSQYKLIE